MYSLILMAAMSGGPDYPAVGSLRESLFGSSCNGCTGCTGSQAKANSEYDTKASCHGGCTGSCHGIFGGRIRSFFSFGGNNCTGNSCNGYRDHRDRSSVATSSATCHGSSCMGTAYAASCQGGLPTASCFGLGLGSMTPSYPGYPDMGVPAIPGGGYAIPSPTPSSYGAPIQYSSSMGCLGGGSTLGTPMPIYGSGIPQMTSPVGEYPTIAPPALPTTPGMPPMVMPFDRPATPTPAPPSIIEDRKQSMTSIANVGSNANRGTVIVRVPTDAKLFAEGRQLTVTNGEKTFTTPPIPSDRDAIYTFRTEYVRDGEVITQTKKVNVRAGGQAVVTFEDLLTRTEKKASAELFAGKSFTPYPTFPVIPLPAVPTGLTAYPTIKPPATEERARITVKLPPSTILYVDGKKSDRTDSIREFLTPVLKPGQDYSYMMRTEPMSGNLGAGQELKIEFRSGQAMLVDFTNPTNPLQPSQNLTAGK